MGPNGSQQVYNPEENQSRLGKAQYHERDEKDNYRRAGVDSPLEKVGQFFACRLSVVER